MLNTCQALITGRILQQSWTRKVKSKVNKGEGGKVNFFLEQAKKSSRIFCWVILPIQHKRSESVEFAPRSTVSHSFDFGSMLIRFSKNCKYTIATLSLFSSIWDRTLFDPESFAASWWLRKLTNFSANYAREVCERRERRKMREFPTLWQWDMRSKAFRVDGSTWKCFPPPPTTDRRRLRSFFRYI